MELRIHDAGLELGDPVDPEPLPTVTPPWRTVKIPADDRTVRIPPDNRTVEVRR